MKNLGQYNLIEEQICRLKCDCNWNITIGGEDRKDLKRLKNWQKSKNNNVVCFSCNKPLTNKSFPQGKWQCEHCGQLLTYEKYKEWYDKWYEKKD